MVVGEPGSGCATTATAYATDSSGYEISVTYPSAGSEPVIAVYAPDGTLVDQSNPPTDSQGRYVLAKDSNGNYFSTDNLRMNFFVGATSGHYYDSLGRIALNNAVGGCTSNPAQMCYYVPNSQGATSEYIVTTASIPVSTDFGEPGVTECNTSCTITVIQSIGLPDGSSYSFKYDCSTGSGNPACGSPTGQSGYYGLLTSVTMPTGGQVTYGYQTFKDAYAAYTRWLNSRVSEGGTWSYAPAVLTTCSVGQTGCQQTTTVTKPSGASKVTTFTLNDGAWPTKIQVYSSGSLVSTITNTFDFSNTCPLLGCTGAAYVRLLTQQTTIVSSTGSITKQTKYAYDTPQTGNVTAVNEWKFLPGASPTFPTISDRATYKTYLTTGTNDINKPLHVNVCNNSGSDSNCTGGGSRVSQTLYTYDGYGAGGPTVVSGIANHDDANFGGTYTTRGNPTQISNWVSGTLYLNTQLSFDTTGQITKSLDPKSNPTSYSYADKFYSDNNANPPATYTPATPTNAYVTGVTTGLGTESFGYYFGSGNRTFYTDLNNKTSYWHFVDPFDRSTETIYPIGWSLASYPSTTENDSYDSVADVSPSTGCSSCQHTQNLLDGLGRETSRKLVNAPNGVVSVDTAYDTNGRVHTVSHPYVSGPVYETYAYDGLDRTTKLTHPDNQFTQAQYGSSTSATQQSSASVYGYGYPGVETDESGKVQLKWLDGFGRTIEVDEGVTVSAPTYATGSIVFSNVSSPSQTIHVGTWSTNFSFSVSTPITEVAQGVASALGGSGLVSATASGSTVSVTSILAGSVGNYALSGSGFTASYNGLSGGTNGATSSQFFTAYTYDAADHLTQVAQGAQTRTFVNDGLGRVSQETTPEAGTMTFSYTTGGTPCGGDPSDICSITDARGLTTSYTYDAENRVSSKTNSAGTVTYSYDQGGAAANAIGRLTKMTDPSGSETYTYDQIGRVTALQKVVGTTTYTTGYQYLGATDGLTQITYPSGRVVQQGYNPVGQVCAVAGQISPTSCTGFTNPYATGYVYDPAGNVTEFSYGNGVAATFSFSAQREQLSSLSYAKGTTSFFSLNYWYQQNSSYCPNGTAGNNGQIQCITDNAQPSRSAFYTYDPMLRLLTAKTTGSTPYAQWGVSETYDRYGNLWTQAVTAGSAPAISLSFGPSGMNSSTTNQPNGYTYDASGNLTVEPLSPANNYTYDANNRLTNFSGGGGSGNYTYDANGVRVQRTANGTTTVSILAGSQIIAEYDNGAAPTAPSREYIYADSESGAQLLALISGSTTTYYHQDQVSIRVITDVNGNDIAEQGHYPFGESWYNASNDKLLFTSYDRDSESGLDYAMARYYNSRVAAFCSADPVEGDPGNPQSWNRYAYAVNDPINLMDPSGKSVLSDILEALSILLAAFPPTAPLGEALSLETTTLALAEIAQFNYFAKSSLQEGQGQQHPTPSPIPGQPTAPEQPPVVPPPGYRACPPITWIITPILKRQATGRDPTRMDSHIPGSASIDPRQVGLDYPGPEDQSNESLKQRSETMRNFPRNPPILLQPVDPLPTGAPNGPWVVRGVGDTAVRSSDVPWADIKVGNNKVHFKTSVRLVVLLPNNHPELTCRK